MSLWCADKHLPATVITYKVGLAVIMSMLGHYIGNYRLVRLLGQGGMGMVFEAMHDGTGGRAAVKVLRTEVASRRDIIARFFNEARAANSISHPGIVRIFDCGYTTTGIAYITMEYLEGESLRQRLARYKKFPISDSLRIARQIASALHAAHQRQVIHRDIKPDTVITERKQNKPFRNACEVLAKQHK